MSASGLGGAIQRGRRRLEREQPVRDRRWRLVRPAALSQVALTDVDDAQGGARAHPTTSMLRRCPPPLSGSESRHSLITAPGDLTSERLRTCSALGGPRASSLAAGRVSRRPRAGAGTDAKARRTSATTATRWCAARMTRRGSAEDSQESSRTSQASSARDETLTGEMDALVRRVVSRLSLALVPTLHARA